MTADTTVEMEILVEGKRGNCLSIKYKGPPEKLVDSIFEQVKNCFPETPEAVQKQKPKR